MSRVLLAFALAFSLGNPAVQSWAEALFQLALPTAGEAGSQWNPNGSGAPDAGNLWDPNDAGSQSDAGNQWDPNG
jgi:hypothetical protein